MKKKKIAINFAGPLSVFAAPGDYPYKAILEAHYEVEISDRPDYLFITQNPKSYRSLLLQYDTAPIRIFNAGEAIVPDFNLCDYGLGFDPIDFGDRYFHIHPFVFFEKDRRPEDLCRATPVAEVLANKDLFCDFIYSNPWAHPNRELFFEMMSEYKPVVSAGKYRNNYGSLSFDHGTWEQAKVEFQRRCKFSIAFENATHSGYTTEKLIHPLLADSIPIYWGNPEVGRYFNARAMLNVHDFESLEQLKRRVIELDGDDEAYGEIVSQPGLSEQQIAQVHENRRGLGEFIRGIFDQPLDKARRRGHGFWNDNYEEKLRQRVALERSLVGKGYSEWRRAVRKLAGRK